MLCPVPVHAPLNAVHPVGTHFSPTQSRPVQQVLWPIPTQVSPDTVHAITSLPESTPVSWAWFPSGGGAPSWCGVVLSPDEPPSWWVPVSPLPLLLLEASAWRPAWSSASVGAASEHAAASPPKRTSPVARAAASKARGWLMIPSG